MTDIQYVPSCMAIIPARAGSKGVPDKNIRDLGGFPLLAWSIAACKLCPAIDRILVSTDSEHYAAIARSYGAEAPFLRPADISGDTATDKEFLCHALQWLQKTENAIPDIIALLRPTSPFRNPEDLTQAISLFAASQASSLCTGYELPESPVKYFKMEADGTFSGFMGDSWLNKRRQDCPAAYVWDGVLDCLRPERIRHEDDMYGPHRLAYVTRHSMEIDAPAEWEYAEYLVQKGAGAAILKELKRTVSS